MKAPAYDFGSEVRRFIEDTPIRSSEPESGTSALLNWIANYTIKRRQFRRKSRCSNLLAEALLSTSLNKAKTDLAKKQEEKRRRLAQFNFSPTPRIPDEVPKMFLKEMTYSQSKQEDAEDEIYDEELKHCLATIDTFFNQLKDVN